MSKISLDLRGIKPADGTYIVQIVQDSDKIRITDQGEIVIFMHLKVIKGYYEGVILCLFSGGVRDLLSSAWTLEMYKNIDENKKLEAVVKDKEVKFLRIKKKTFLDRLMERY